MKQRNKNKSNFKKGSVEMLLLHLLETEGDCYGYQLSQLINQRSNGVLVIPEGSMYPTLYKLIDNEYISDYKKTVGKRMTRVYYHLEESGKQRLAELVEDYKEVASAIEKIMEL
ncbi:MAG: PadR family transcriptional regulator [Emergencia sp.]|nr:PadR family transcriptional regulator [Emergencia sp.]